MAAYTAHMQVTLTSHAAELLRAELARDPHQSPAGIIEQALVERVERKAATPAPTDPVWAKLTSIPGVKLPDHWPPRFSKFEPLEVEGEPISEQLIRERR